MVWELGCLNKFEYVLIEMHLLMILGKYFGGHLGYVSQWHIHIHFKGNFSVLGQAFEYMLGIF